MTTYHFIGLGGSGQNVVARLLAARGETVQGSDNDPASHLHGLADEGITVHIGHAAENVPDDAVVVISTAISEANPELAIARKRGQRVIHRSEALALAAQGMEFVSVAGSHGKTSTTGMIAYGLATVGLDPSYAIGGELSGTGTGAHLGKGNVFVAEADESDGSFLNYDTRIGVITNIERDHPQKYKTDEQFEEIFHEFAAQIRPEGLLVVCGDDEGARRVAQKAPVRTVQYGRTVAPEGLNIHVGEGEFSGDGWTVALRPTTPGSHHELNSAAAIAVARELGVAPAEMAAALASYPGTGRRFEVRGVKSGVTVVDDYGHHPTEVAATIATAREIAEGRVLVLFQPALFTRTIEFAAEFAAALDTADEAIVCDIYGSREAPMGFTSEIITEKMAAGEYIPDRFDAARELASRARPGDYLITLGSGSVTEMVPVVLDTL
ncbi:UDP-N-acetylmuramate--L-alanine ligase [Ruaniaceae bacterium KH17]|nr:UDP-N-acetylmuramate--L-alanine ligase [Ruaniaceae bacterium KH17]